MNPFETLIVLVWVLSALPVIVITARRKGRPRTAFLLGLLGWIGVLVIAVTPATRAARVQRERERLEIQREARG